MANVMTHDKRKLILPAAMMAGITDHLWSFDEFYKTMIQYG